MLLIQRNLKCCRNRRLLRRVDFNLVSSSSLSFFFLSRVLSVDMYDGFFQPEQNVLSCVKTQTSERSNLMLCLTRKKEQHGDQFPEHQPAVYTQNIIQEASKSSELTETFRGINPDRKTISSVF